MGLFSRKIKDKKEESVPASSIKEVAGTSQEAKPAKVNASALKFVSSVLVQPRVSEKAGSLSKLNKYVFLVERSANKISVKKAVERVYKVKVIQVNMVNVKGKRRYFGRIWGKMSDFRKAIVTLKKGDRIEGVVETV